MGGFFPNLKEAFHGGTNFSGEKLLGGYSKWED